MCRSPTIDTLKKVFKNLRQNLNIAEEAPIADLKTNVLIWGLLMSTTMKTSVRHGPNYSENLEVYRNTNFEELKNLSGITQRFILEHDADILNVSTIDWQASSRTRSTLMHDQVIKWTKATVHVHSGSVLCFGKMQDHSAPNQIWNAQLKEFQQSNFDRE